MSTKKQKKKRRFNKLFLSSVMFAFAIAVAIPIVTKALVLDGGPTYWMLGRAVTDGRHITNYRTFADGSVAYCLEAHKASPGDGSDLGSNGIYANDNVWKAIKYGYPHRTWYDNSTELGRWANYYVTQMAVWSYTEPFDDAHINSLIGNPKYEKQGLNTGQLKANIINFRKEIANMGETQQPSISVDQGTVTAQANAGEDAVTPWITMHANNINGSVNIALKGAPSGTIIENESGAHITTVPVNSKFRFKIPNEHANGTFKYSMSADGDSLKAVSYEGGGSNQDLVAYQPVKVKVDAKEEGTVNFQNQPKEGWAQIRKIDSDSKQPIEGVTFELRQNGQVKAKGTTDANGVMKVKVKAGDYDVYEVAAPPQYVMAKDPMKVTIRNQNETVDLEFPNRPVHATVRLYKKDSETGKRLAGATFVLYQNGKEAYRTTSGADGIAILEKIRFGDYELKEVTAPNGYVINKEPVKVKIDHDGQKIELQMPNRIIKGNVEVKKVDSEFPDMIIKGAKFGLFQGDKKIHEATTGEDGIAKFSNVNFGKYTLKEIQPAEGYQPTTKTWDVDIKEDGKTYNYDVQNNIIKGKIQIVKIDSEDEEKPVKGAVFGVYKASDLNKEIAKITTDENGFAFTGELRYGDYVLKELDAPGDYYINEKLYPVSIKEHGKVEIKYIVNKPVEFRLKVLKIDGEDKKPLEGAHFQIHQNGKPVEFTYQVGNKVVKEDTFVTDKDGMILLPKELRAGSYELVEVLPPTGYQPIKPIPFTVDRNTELGHDDLGPILEVTVENNIIKGNVLLKKVDKKDNKPLEGVKFELYKTKTVPQDTAGKTVAESKDGDKANAPKDESLVSKAVDFVKGLLPTKKADASKVSVSMDDTQMATAPNAPTEENKEQAKPEGTNKDQVKPDESNKENTSKDEAKPEGENKEEAKPEDKPKLTPSQNLMNGEGNKLENGDVQVGLYETDKDGQIYVEGLKFGDYYFKEVATKEGYVLDDKPVQFQITEHDKTIELTKENRRIEAPVEITKTDVSTGQVLPNTGIKIYAEDGKTVVTEGRTDDTGKFTFKLEYGKYFFQEFEAPEGYVIDESLHPFEIKTDGEIVKCQMTNKKIQGTLEITKVDVSDGKLLPNTTFAIYNVDEKGNPKDVVVKGKTNDKGIATFKLDYGHYYYQEIEAPEGYMIDQTKFPFVIEKDGQIVQAKMTNSKLPKTGTINKTTSLAVAGGVSLVGIAGFVLSRRFRA
ncbi:hypothetical protein UT300012_22950 [Paraclostridium bifermentans]